MTRKHLLLTPDNEDYKVFRDVPIIRFHSAKILRISLWVQKYLKLKTKVGAAPVKDLDVKFANILSLPSRQLHAQS